MNSNESRLEEYKSYISIEELVDRKTTDNVCLKLLNAPLRKENETRKNVPEKRESRSNGYRA